MNKLQTDGHDVHQFPDGPNVPDIPDTHGLRQRERLSALADGQLAGAELAAALEFATTDEAGRAHWHVWHLIGDVLRSPDLARPGSPEFMPRLRARLAQEAPPERPRTAQPLLQTLAPAHGAAANAALFRWKLLAGCAALAAAAAVGWSALAQLQAADGAPQLASAPAPAAAPAGVQPAPLLAQAEPQAQQGQPGQPDQGQPQGQAGQQMIRDPRLDELLAAHKQFGSMSALQMPAGFLRNATFEAPER